MDTSKIVGEKIKSLRENRNISMEELAQRSGLAVEQVERIENNIDLPSLAPLIKIARVLGVRLGTFLDDQDETGPAVCRRAEAGDTISFSNNAIQSRRHMEPWSTRRPDAPARTSTYIQQPPNKNHTMAVKIAFFDAKDYDRESFNRENQTRDYDIHYYKDRLSAHTAELARGKEVACIFVNAECDAHVIGLLKEYGVKLIALRCAGFNNVDVQAAKDAGIRVVRVPAYSPHAVAEYAVTLMLCLNRKVYRSVYRTREGNFKLKGLMGFDMYGKTAGIVGMGKIAKELIKILRGFGMNILAYDPFPDQAFADAHQTRIVTLEELYAGSDIISLHCPLTDDTRFLVNSQSIAQMRRGVMIINTGRGKLIKTGDLIEGLRSGQVGSAGLDVYEEEQNYFYEDRSDKMIDDDKLALLLMMPNVILTSHQAFFTREAMHNIAATTLDNIADWTAGRELKNEVK